MMGLAVVAYLSPLYEMFVALMLFVAADMVTGVLASKRRRIPRSSRRLRRSVAKLVNYILAMTLAYTAEHAFDVEWFVAHRAIGAFICAVEMLSILENMAVSTGHPVFLAIVKWFRGKVSEKDDVIKEIINEKNDLAIGDSAGDDVARLRGKKPRDGFGGDAAE